MLDTYINTKLYITFKMELILNYIFSDDGRRYKGDFNACL